MRRTVIHHFRRNVVAYLALFLALGGTSYATWLAPANSVNSQAIIDGQVTTPDLAANAIRADEFCLLGSCVGSKEIANNAVSTSEIAGGAVGNSQLAANAVTGDKVKDGSLTAADIAGGIPPSDAYIARNDAEQTINSPGAPIVSLNLPAGYYTLTAETEIHSGGTNPEVVECTLSTGATTKVFIPAEFAGGGESVTVEDVLTLTAPGTASLSCYTNNYGTADHAKLIAVKVAALHG